MLKNKKGYIHIWYVAEKMCGILGGNSDKWDYEKGIQILSHRGPDGKRIEKYPDCTLAFARLAIMDPSESGMQPMADKTGDVIIIYNGEIYGYDAIKRELERKYEFRSRSDTEVILNAYMEYGDGFIDKIDGMFAIAIYDRRIRQIKLFRDRTGIKPLYYYCNGGRFAFASELKAIVSACTNVPWEIDYTALYDYLFYQYIPDPKTMYVDCFKLPPAHMLTYDLSRKKISGIKKYWKLHVNTQKGRYRKEEAICDELRGILSHSVQKQLIADVPVGCFLSGGIDSGIIAYESHKYSPDIRTYTIGFKSKQYDESGKAGILTKKYDINAVQKILDAGDIADLKNKLRGWYDEPFADTSAYPSYIVSKLAREDVTVVLTGDGGDELFGGYKRYELYADAVKGKWIDSEILSLIGKLVNGSKALFGGGIKKILNTGMEAYFPYVLLAEKERVEAYRKIWHIGRNYDPCWYIRKYYKKELPPITRVRYLDYKTYLPGDILTKMDRVSMANSLEVRVPFLGREVVEFAFSLSEEECCNSRELKKVLKDAYKEAVPHQILYGAKKGFGVPPDYLKANRNRNPVTCGILDQEWKELLI